MGLHFGEGSEVQADPDSSMESESSVKRDPDLADPSADTSIDGLEELGELLYPDSPMDTTLPDFLPSTPQTEHEPTPSSQPTLPSAASKRSSLPVC